MFASTKYNKRYIATVLTLALVLTMLFATGGPASMFLLRSSASSPKTEEVMVEKVNGTWRTVYKKNRKAVNYNGVAENKYGWWYCKDGKVQFGHYGIQNNDYGWWRIEDGKVNFKANGVFKNQYGWYYCRKGKVDFKYNGLAKNQYGTWSIKKGKVDFNDTKKLGYDQKSNDVVKTVEADWAVERHTYSYAYDLKNKTIKAEDLLTFAGGGWGGAGPFNELADELDGLLTMEMVKEYPELLTQACEGGFNDFLLLACNPYIRGGKVTKMTVTGKGEVVAEEGKGTSDEYTVRNHYQETYTFTAKNGMLQKCSYNYRNYEDDTNYTNNYSFKYDSAGLLTKVTSTDGDVITITRDEYGFPKTVYYYFYPFDESYTLNYNASRQVTKVNAKSEYASTKAFQYNTAGKPVSAKITDTYVPFTLQFSYASDVLVRLERQNPTLEDANTIYTWTQL